MVAAILWYARAHYQDFVQDIKELICYDGADYSVKWDIWEALCEKWKKGFPKGTEKSGRCFLTPEKSADYFFSATKIGRELVDEIIPFEKIQGTAKVSGTEGGVSDSKVQETRKAEEEMKLFFYCSTPSRGFLLNEVDAATGNVLSEGKEAAGNMPGEAFAIMTRSGARMALFDIEGVLCFVAKNIRSAAKDHYGRQKYLSIAFLAKEESKNMLRRFAAWALLEFAAFSEELTECLQVLDGPAGYTVDIASVRKLLGRFEESGSCMPIKQRGVWEHVMAADNKKRFVYLLADASLEYFNRMTGLSINKQQISMLISEDRFQEWNELPLDREGIGRMEVPRREPKGQGQAFGWGSKGHGETLQEERLDLLQEKWFRYLLCGGIVLIFVCSVILIARGLLAQQ